ncbi:MAG: dTMP kinase [Deltaproteobacteria bacterium RBG_16_71_12]|nr:MAG: dTMP kinase [Deltaproteobacteria bacterium RBG_16_71_12]
MRGRLIVLEGADGTGTTTQARTLAHHLTSRGRTVHVTAEPSRGPIGALIRQLLSGDRPREQIHRELALLFAADRLDHVAREIEPELARGVDVISDRYLLSSLVYQGLDLPIEWVASLNQHAPAADVTLLVTLPVEAALARIAGRAGQRELFDARETQARVHARYLELAPRVDAVVVDGQGPIAEVSARLIAALERQLAGVREA